MILSSISDDSLVSGKRNEEAASVQSKAVTEDGGDVVQAAAAAAPQLSEFVVSVSAVLETTEVSQAAKSRVMNVVSRLVDKLHRAEEEKDTATLQLKGKTRRISIGSSSTVKK